MSSWFRRHFNVHNIGCEVGSADDGIPREKAAGFINLSYCFTPSAFSSKSRHRNISDTTPLLAHLKSAWKNSTNIQL